MNIADWFTNNKDAIIIAVISALIGSIITGVISYIIFKKIILIKKTKMIKMN